MPHLAAMPTMANKITLNAEKAHNLLGILQTFADTFEWSKLGVGNAYALILELGQSFTAQAKPKGIKWGKKKRCYDNAYDLIVKHPTMIYCEGYVFLEKVALPIEHAWCIDEAGGVVDNTVRASTVAYFGIPFDRTWATRMIESGAVLLVDHLLSLKKIPKSAIAKAYRRRQLEGQGRNKNQSKPAIMQRRPIKGA